MRLYPGRPCTNHRPLIEVCAPTQQEQWSSRHSSSVLETGIILPSVRPCLPRNRWQTTPTAPRYSAQFRVPSRLQDMPANMATMLPENFDLPAESQESLQMELDRWVVRWSRAVGETPTDILDTRDNTVEILYPNIYRALAIVLTTPVSTATTERPFNAMRRLKPYFRSTMLTNRLTGLALMNVYGNTFTDDLHKAVNVFARKKPRSWDLMLDWTRSPWAKVD